MPNRTVPDATSIPWKWIAVGMAVVFSTALITGVVVAHYAGSSPHPDSAQVAALPPDAQEPPSMQPQSAPPQAAPPQAPALPAAPRVAAPPPPPPRAAGNGNAAVHHERARPSLADIDECNRYASATGDKTTETLKDALVGAAAGAGLGAAGGAIAGGGRGAGKGAGIGGLVGAAAGTVFGLNDAQKNDARVEAAYRACMRRRGYTD